VRKFIFVTGGVLSGLGKGVVSASIGLLLKLCGYRVSLQKIDPYVNVDAGTMNPYEHGEVFVTHDGRETDLDIGRYERFLDMELSSSNYLTTGQVYWSVIRKERAGRYLGQTVQVIPHVTDEIKRRIRALASESKADVVIVEIGGTVGDIESLPFLEAIRQMRQEIGFGKTCYAHLTLLPYIKATDELKTKPTQHSVHELRGIGISPDVLLCRADYSIPPELLDKIALFGSVERKAVIPLETASSIYQVPLMLEQYGLGDYLVNRLGLDAAEPDLTQWRDFVHRLERPEGEVRIALVGKYVALHDAYLSVHEALIHAAAYHRRRLELDWIHAEEVESDDLSERLSRADGIVVPGGFGPRGIEGKILTARYAREQRVPYLGLCLGLQVMIIEFARHVAGMAGANSSEFDEHTAYPVVDLMPDQVGVVDKGATMRLGNYPCRLLPGTRAQAAYGSYEVQERHRHRYEVNNDLREALAAKGMVWSGVSPSGHLVEVAELRDHPYMLGSQFHPEFKSRPDAPQPLFREFIRAAIDRQR